MAKPLQKKVAKLEKRAGKRNFRKLETNAMEIPLEERRAFAPVTLPSRF